MKIKFKNKKILIVLLLVGYLIIYFLMGIGFHSKYIGYYGPAGDFNVNTLQAENVKTTFFGRYYFPILNLGNGPAVDIWIKISERKVILAEASDCDLDNAGFVSCINTKDGVIYGYPLSHDELNILSQKGFELPSSGRIPLG